MLSRYRGSAADACPVSRARAFFDPGAARILRLKRLRCFPLPGRLGGLRVRLRLKAERSPGVALRGAETVGARLAAPAIFGRALHLAHWVPAGIESRRPARARPARWAGGVLPVPIHLAVLGLNASPLAGWPVIVGARRPQESHTLTLATLDQECGV